MRHVVGLAWCDAYASVPFGTRSHGILGGACGKEDHLALDVGILIASHATLHDVIRTRCQEQSQDHDKSQDAAHVCYMSLYLLQCFLLSS